MRLYPTAVQFGLALILTSLIFMGCRTAAPTFRTFDKPVIFDAERQALSIEYLRERHQIEKNTASINPKIVVLHWTAIATLESSFNAMNPVILPGARTNLAGASRLNVAAQFLVDRDGTIFRLLPDTAFGRHVIGLNHAAIGVENVGGSDAPLTRKQLLANEAIIRYLKKRYPIEYVIGHHEYKNFIGHPLWKESDPNYLTSKSDPGDKFMKKIHSRIRDLNIKPAPQKP